jgi:DNA modification methylase
VSQAGDVWTLGRHRLVCGDCTDAAVVANALNCVRPHLMVTDPPYGVAYEPTWREQAGLGKQRQTGAVVNDDVVDWTSAYQLFPGHVVYIWHAGVHTAQVAANILQCGFEIRSQIIWAKQHFAIGRAHYHWQHEPCWYAVRRQQSARWRGDRTQSTVWQVSNLNPFGGDAQEPATGHSTQKPVELMRRPILNHTEPGEAVFDPFLGSGTTLIAAELTNHVSFGLEISPAYIDVIVSRWEKMSGQTALLEENGRTFAQTQADRASTASVATPEP